jgi:hypothetical protein
MSPSGEPAATVHPGAVVAIFDHLIIALTPDGQPGPALFLFSHYRFRWADDGLVGELAFVELDGRRFVLSDEPRMAATHAGRLSPAAWAGDAKPPLTIAPTVAAFTSSGFGGASVRERVAFDDMVLELEWTNLAAPIFATGPAPRVPSQDIVSVLIEAGAARATVNEADVAGGLFANDAWVAWLGRPLSSAVVAIGEVLLERP